MSRRKRGQGVKGDQGVKSGLGGRSGERVSVEREGGEGWEGVRVRVRGAGWRIARARDRCADRREYGIGSGSKIGKFGTGSGLNVWPGL